MISRTVLALAASLALALPALGQSLGSVAPAQAPRTIDSTSMYEDIEIFRRLLNSKLGSQYAPLKTLTANWNVYCTTCHVGNLEKTNPVTTWEMKYGGSDFTQFHNPYYPTCTRSVHGLDAQPLGTEGVYLKNQGVIFTLTLPVPKDDPRPGTPAPSPKGLSDWDRVRHEVRNEKPAEEVKGEGKGEPKKEPTLGELLLKLMADNGQHFKELPETESLTIVVTFREPNLRAATRRTLYGTGWTRDHSPFLETVYANGTNEAGKPAVAGLGFSPPAPGIAPLVLDPKAVKTVPPDSGTPSTPQPTGNSAKDYELLGDLHAKSGKNTDAIGSYKKALETTRDTGPRQELCRKLAQVYLASGQVIDAREWLDRALATKSTPSPAQTTAAPAAAPAKPLPNKLILSASKKLLTAVGTGKMSMEEFQKSATVEYVMFPAAKK